MAISKDQELRNYVDWCAAHRIKNEDADPTQDTAHNAQVVSSYFWETWKQPNGQPTEMTRANLDKALPQLRNQLRFYSSEVQANYGKLSNQLTQAERDTVSAWLNRQTLQTEGDAGLHNQTTLVQWLKSRNMPISSENLSIARGNITNNPGPQLVWKKQKVEKQEREVSDAEIATLQSIANGIAVRTPSGLINNSRTAEIQKIIVNGQDGKPDWHATIAARRKAGGR